MFTTIEYLASRPDREPLPNTDDVAAASEAVARLAHVYRLNTTALTEGGRLVLDPMTDYHHSLSGVFIIYRHKYLLGDSIVILWNSHCLYSSNYFVDEIAVMYKLLPVVMS